MFRMAMVVAMLVVAPVLGQEREPGDGSKKYGVKKIVKAPAPRDPTRLADWLYRNQDGTFWLEGGGAQATYVWKMDDPATPHRDELRFKAEVEVAGAGHRGWWFEAPDSGFGILFCYTPIWDGSRYPVYFTFDGGQTFHRWLTYNGTTRTRIAVGKAKEKSRTKTKEAPPEEPGKIDPIP